MSVAYDSRLERLERNVTAVIGLGDPVARGGGTVGVDRSGVASASVAVLSFVAVLGGLSAGLVHLWPKLAVIEPPVRASKSSAPVSASGRDEVPFTPIFADLRPLEPEPAAPAPEASEGQAAESTTPAPLPQPGLLASVTRPSAARPRAAAAGEARPEAVQVAAVMRPAEPVVALGPEVVMAGPVVVAAPAFAPPPAAAPAAAMAMSLPSPPDPVARVKRRDSVSALMTLRRQW